MSTPGKISKRAAAADPDADNETPLKRTRTDERPSTSGLSKLGGLNGLSSRKDRHDKPDELFRKDLISAMKLADAEHLEPDTYVTIQDPWRQEWERGVQVPVHSTLKSINLRIIPGNELLHGDYAFKMPKKMLYANKDDNYQVAIHELHETHKLAEQVCRYDLDDMDVNWLTHYNDKRVLLNDKEVLEWEMEKIMEELETQCYNNMQNKIKTVEGLGIEYDENVVCDVCRSPEGEDNNEMVFCDQCDICVHQACYGVNSIPEGSWLCRTCAIGVTPNCILCPKLGGAMKSTKSGSKWAHVACALWIPEVSIGCPEKMEPITKISQIPASRWALVCSICRVKEGACIQCSVKTCKTAFHVTCAFSNNLDMKTILDEEQDDVQLKAYCPKHSKKSGEMTPKKTGKDGMPGSPVKKESEMTEEEKTELRSHRLAKLAEEFYSCVESVEVAKSLKLEDEEMVDHITGYWVLKRKANFNKPLLTPKTEEADLLSKQREDSLIARMKMFIHLRQDLERVRNLCYMVSRREKTRRQLYRLKEDIFHKQAELVNEPATQAEEGSQIYQHIVEAHKLDAGDSVYDQYDQILHVAQEALTQAQLQDDAASIAGSLDGSIKAETHSRRPSIETSDDEDDFTEKSNEEYSKQKNSKMIGLRKAKLARDRKENDRRKALEQLRQLEEKQAQEKAAAESSPAEAGEAAKSEEVDKPAVEDKPDGKTPGKGKKGKGEHSPRGRSPAGGRSPRGRSPGAGGKGKGKDRSSSGKRGKGMEEGKDAEKSKDKAESSAKAKDKAESSTKSKDKAESSAKSKDKAESSTKSKEATKKGEEKRDKSPRGRPPKNKKQEANKEKDKEGKQETGDSPPNVRTTRARSEGAPEKEDGIAKTKKEDAVSDKDKEKGKRPEEKEKVESKKGKDGKVEKGVKAPTKDTKESSKPEESSDTKDESSSKGRRGRKRTLSVTAAVENKNESNNSATQVVSPTDTPVPPASRGRGRPRKSVAAPTPGATPKDTDSKSNSKDSPGVGKATASPTDSKGDVKTDSSTKVVPPQSLELLGEMSPEIPTLPNSKRSRTLRSVTPLSARSSTPVQESTTRSLRSSTPLTDDSVPKSGDLPDAKAKECSDGSVTVVEISSDNEKSSDDTIKASRKPRLSLRRCSGASPPYLSPTQATELKEFKTEIKESKDDKSSKDQQTPPTANSAKSNTDVSKASHNLKVKDQNRPSPKSIKEKLAQKNAKKNSEHRDDSRDEKIDVNGFRFLRSQLTVAESFKQKVSDKLQQLQQARILRGTNICAHAKAKLNGLLKDRNGSSSDKKENNPASPLANEVRRLADSSPSSGRASPMPPGKRAPSVSSDAGRRRSLRHHSESDHEQNMSANSSPAASPRARTRKSQDFARLATERSLVQKLNGGMDVVNLDSDSDSQHSVMDIDSDTSEWNPADERSSRRRSSRLSKPIEIDEDSQNSVASNASKFSTRSTRQSTDFSKAFSSLPS